ncbi:class I SAM-dependent methyltransferase [Paraliobacillus zengyii]|uniref:class I SAM-dependent methyltransferase n=1 Tax=Paraliobacillus zengyii TaxID=2213194 RepID=UPI0013009B1A|nr:methyltransferase domain-containing protein [Paraliobacillus zengyii]
MTNNIDAFSNSLESYRNYTEMPWGKLFYSTVLSQIEQHLSGQKYVLDIGCGFGLTALSLAQKGFKVMAVEPNKELLNMAKEKALDSGVAIEFRNLNMTQLDSFECTVDFLICHNVLEYVDNPEKAIRDLADKTKNKGYLSLITHNPLANVLKKAIVDKSPAKALTYIGKKSDYSAVIGAETSLYTNDDIQKWLNNAGFKVVNRYGVHNLYGYIDNEFKFDPDWNKQMTELEMQVSSISPYRDIAVFTHTIAQLT